MYIPTEPIGSIPRPLQLVEALSLTHGSDPALDPLYDAAIRDTIERFEATGSPVITDGALTLAESGAIIEYLVERYDDGGLVPATGTPEKLRYSYWLHYAEGSMQPMLLMKLIFDRIEKAPMPFFARPIARAISGKTKSSFIEPNIKRHLDYMEAELGKTPWFAGNEFTAADVQMSFPLEAATVRGGLDSRWPNLIAFLGRIHARPAYKQAIERGGEYQLLR